MPSVVALGACGYDVEINVPGGQMVTDALGLGKKKAEPQLRERGPLVAPPKGAALPEPGSGHSDQRQIAATTEDWPVDPDVKARQIKAAEDSQRNKEISEEERLRGMAVNNEDPAPKRLFQNKKVPDKYRKEEGSDEDNNFPGN